MPRLLTEHRQIAAPKPPTSEQAEKGLPREEVHAVLDRIAEPIASELPKEEEWQARKDRLKKAALEWAAERGLSTAESNPPVAEGIQPGGAKSPSEPDAIVEAENADAAAIPVGPSMEPKTTDFTTAEAQA